MKAMPMVYHERYVEHIQGSRFHPESPERLLTIKKRLEEADLWKELLTPEALSERELQLVHTSRHIERLKNFGVGPLDPDTYMSENTYEIAKLAAGGTVCGLRHVIAHDEPVFVFPRPPGHHAGQGYCGGFCYFNNVAIATKKFLEKLGKVAIVDIDVHHGNGTNDIFYQEDKVLFISTHQYGIFPGTGHHTEVGSGAGRGYSLNIPFSAYAGDSSMLIAFDKIIMMALEQFSPGAIIVSLGTDGHYNDPLSSNVMSSLVYAEVIKKLLHFAEENCQNRILINLEGGYHLESLAEIVTHLVSLVYTGEETELKHKKVYDKEGNSLKSIRESKEFFAKFWEM
ncbi:MAG TPA: histone deacetylase [Thermoplasmata archaeon]|nr:histone deacetylase [Thermoplasmata archaeon]